MATVVSLVLVFGLASKSWEAFFKEANRLVQKHKIQIVIHNLLHAPQHDHATW